MEPAINDMNSVLNKKKERKSILQQPKIYNSIRNELGDCSCQSLQVAGTDSYDGRYEVDEPDTDPPGEDPDAPPRSPGPAPGEAVPPGRPVPAPGEGDNRSGGEQAQETHPRRQWPTWTLRKDVRPSGRPVESSIGATVSKLNLDPSLRARLQKGKNIDRATFDQITAPHLASTRTSSDFRGHLTKGHSLLGDSSKDVSGATMHREKSHFLLPGFGEYTMSNQKFHYPNQNVSDQHDVLLRALVSKVKSDGSIIYAGNLHEKLKEYTKSKSKPGEFPPYKIPRRRKFNRIKKGYKQVRVGFAEHWSPRNPIKLTRKQSYSRNLNYVSRSLNPIFSEPSLGKGELNNLSEKSSGHIREHYGKSERENGLPKAQHNRHQIDDLPKVQSSVIVHASTQGSTPDNLHVSHEGFTDGFYSDPGTFSDSSWIAAYKGDESALGRQLQERHLVRLQWDEELSTLVLVRGETLLAISNNSGPCPHNSSGSWWQLFDEPRAFGSYNMETRDSHDQDYGIAETDQGSPGLLSRVTDDQEPLVLYVSSEEQGYGDIFHLPTTNEQNSDARLERRHVTITCVHDNT